METKNKSTDKSKSEFKELFLHELKDIYWAENHLVKSLPKMAKAASSKKLSDAIKEHKKETENQIKRLEKVFELINEKASGKKCEAMAGLLEEAEEILESTSSDSMVRDAGIIIASQKIEHYEIASYGALVQLAKQMGNTECANLLEETLKEEKNADALLTKIAESEVNQMAENE